jgi:class 3 adenylate cyclase
MFCDLVGSTAISAQLDAEEWRDLVGAYLDAASVAVAQMGGHVAKKLGDGLTWAQQHGDFLVPAHKRGEIALTGTAPTSAGACLPRC